MDQILSPELPKGTSLGEVLRDLKDETGLSLDKLTVLSSSNDPFRLDTPANHRNGQWLRDTMQECGVSSLHLRGIHYALMSSTILKPDGKRYKNTHEDWLFLQDDASKAARWLGYVDFDRINDARNSEPILRRPEIGLQLSEVIRPSVYDVPGIEEFRFKVRCHAYVERQPYNLVIFGEKTSLLGPLSTIADRYGADVYLPSGEISDTLLHIMAKTGDADGREMVVFVIADCDPAGYQMTASIAHKLRALRELKFPNLRFRVEAPALTVEQVKEYGLPSTPLKETEKRAAGWLARYGVEQTEIDALATLRPQLFREIIEEAIRPYYDFDISERVADSRRDWNREASGRLDAALEAADLTGLYADLKASLEDAEEKATALSERAEEVHVQLPEIDVPKSDIAEPAPAYISSEMDLLDAIQTLRARKDYGGARP